MFAQSAMPTAKRRFFMGKICFFNPRRFNNTATHTHQNFIKPVGTGVLDGPKITTKTATVYVRTVGSADSQ